MDIQRILGRAYFTLAYPLYYKHKLAKTNHARLFGFSLTIPPHVFHPGLFFSTRIFGGYLRSLSVRDADVLEMGCGSGLLSLIMAANGASVTSIDINPAAVECTRVNALNNGLTERIMTLQSDLFHGLPEGRRFDLIIWNPPFYPKEPGDDANHAWNAGEGYRILRRFAAGASGHLKEGGKILLILTYAQVDVRTILGFFAPVGFTSSTVLTRRSMFETFAVHEFRRADELHPAERSVKH